MNTFVGFNLKRPENNDDEGFMLQRILLEGALVVSVGYFHGRVSEGCCNLSRRAMDKKSQSQGSELAPACTVQKKKMKILFRTLQACPLSLHIIQLQSRK